MADLTELKKESREAFKELSNVEYFKQFQINDWTLEWPNGYDIAPDYLYKISTPAEIKAAG